MLRIAIIISGTLGERHGKHTLIISGRLGARRSEDGELD